MEKKIQFETFRALGTYEQIQMTQKEPSSFNGWIRIRKYRVTVEPIDEPKDVLQERLQALWDNCDNHHHCSPIRAEAKKLGYELKGNAGNKLKRNQ